MTDIRSMYLDELKNVMAQLGEKPFRAAQLFSWLHEKQAESYDEMSNLSSALRQKLSEEFRLVTLKQADCLVSKKDGTRKYLFELPDGNVIESVLMKYHHGNSVCISSQVGCSMGCAFCASTIGGKVRDLAASEMLEQIYRIQKLTGERVSNIVVMGSGEPFDNYDNLIRFIKLASDGKGMNISIRNITVSTCGIVPKMYEFADEKLPVTLAVSLHASNDDERKQLMPIAKRYSVKEVMRAAKNYFEVTGRRVTFEYALVAGKNDSKDDADRLSALLKGFPCHVNLIPVNPVNERNFRPPRGDETVNFQNKLEKNRINVTIRREMGSDINGACGQLRKSYISKIQN
ncbi:MAG TPA: 23S rRNA (adenine(2503)-C(2))-methyltransferase RlmN [Candidatus Alectryocaccobium stercorigallinarum]|jgi:23S rRNA (adenine2503-C2)-methyltransferase|nr:23S rRNA (adenine(2503)-C(2))-methyltransferase RlmN [Candidatus Alectryocaccobium stercorigallinarum]